MESINVQFADDSEESIVSYFPGPQDPSAFPHQGTVESSDQRWATFYEILDPFTRSLLPSPG